METGILRGKIYFEISHDHIWTTSSTDHGTREGTASGSCVDKSRAETMQVPRELGCESGGHFSYFQAFCNVAAGLSP